jgi:hypothetical protein
MLENWRSTDVQRDPGEFRRAQAAVRERQDAKAKKQQEADDVPEQDEGGLGRAASDLGCLLRILLPLSFLLYL